MSKKGSSRRPTLDEDFFQTYQGPTALYSLLHIKHTKSPLFLPRTLSYRIHNKSKPKKSTTSKFEFPDQVFYPSKKASTIREKPITIIKKSKKQLSKPKQKKNQKQLIKHGVWFHYLYRRLLCQNREHRVDLTCPWCKMYTASLEGLICHLICSHSRFRFHMRIDTDEIPHVFVLPREDHDVDSKETYVFSKILLHQSKIKTKDPMNTLEEHVSNTLSKFKLKDKSSTKTESLSATRQYFHSRTGAIVTPDEFNYDSDDDVDEEWILQQSEKMVDDFIDVSIEEKELMKMWNRHAHEFRILSDRDVSKACYSFAMEYKEKILKKGLRHNFLLHLFNLWDNSLLSSQDILDSLNIVDNAIKNN